MSLYVLDTDMLTLVEEGHPEASERFLQQRSEEVAVTVVSVEEQLSGWYAGLRKAKRPERLAWAYRRLADTVRFLSRLQILTYDEPAMQRYDQLRKRKVKIGRMDLRIAATVLEHSAVLVTRNYHDFKQVPGLKIEDWSR
ncbi:MAG TPA: type II toxin-antitoxin system VapC family toxin [Gemmataceae bacterium]|jgi:tRNA(fMet)-specific endonuclease VapC|nr:type II toxin-antitoxin system VapC family toxin [Gemmataceae bacterium]